MNSKSAGIITLYASQNFGAFLQGYAMQTTLQKLGYTPEFIKYSGLDIHEFLFMVKTKNVRLAAFRLMQFAKYMRSRNLLKVAQSRYHGEYKDAVVIGSDTLWDVQNPTIHDSNFYLGKGLNCNNIIAYAPSANGTSPKEFCEHYGSDEKFDAFTAIGVRDNNTAKLVQDVSGKKAEIVLDPTLLLKKEDYPVVKPQEQYKYVLVYGYSFRPEEQKVIKEYANRIGVKTISIGLLNSWCDKNVVATVPEFLGYINSAEGIFTATFHGTIFSIIMEKQFITFARSNYKVLDNLEKLGLNSRNASQANVDCSILMEKEIDYFSVNERIAFLREKSMSFLRDSLGD